MGESIGGGRQPLRLAPPPPQPPPCIWSWQVNHDVRTCHDRRQFRVAFRSPSSAPRARRSINALVHIIDARRPSSGRQWRLRRRARQASNCAEIGRWARKLVIAHRLELVAPAPLADRVSSGQLNKQGLAYVISGQRQSRRRACKVARRRTTKSGRHIARQSAATA